MFKDNGDILVMILGGFIGILFLIIESKTKERTLSFSYNSSTVTLLDGIFMSSDFLFENSLTKWIDRIETTNIKINFLKMTVEF